VNGYDELVAGSPQGSVFARSWWLDAVAPGGWRAHVVELGGARAAWPTVHWAGRYGAVHLGAPLTPYLGPILPARAGNPHKARSQEVHLVEALVEAIGRHAHLEARCHPAFSYWTPLAWHGFAQTTRYTWRLAPGDAEAAFRGLRENVRTDVRKAGRQGITVGEGALVDFLPLRAHTLPAQRAAGATSAPGALIRRLDAAAAEHAARTVLVARDGEGRPHAGAYLVHDDRFTYYLMAGSDPELRGSGAASLVLWTAVERALGRGAGFDFEGSMLRPVERFFRAFGGDPAPYSVVRSTPSAALRAEVAVKRGARRLLRRR
jgi:Acetyltransferase (GNAT) domain